MKKIILTTFILTILVQKNLSTDSLIFNYYPLKIGNSWTYLLTSVSPPNYTSYRYRISVIDTVRFNSHLYFKLYRSNDSVIFYRRVDSSSGNILQYSTSGCSWLNNSILVDSLASKLGDESSANCVSVLRTICADTSLFNIFGLLTRTKTFNRPSSSSGSETRYAFGFGFVYYHFLVTIGPGGETTITLKGCVINGNVYGDTTLPIGISQINNEIPEVFKLYINYPNPFNPLTKIRFEIPKSSFAKLIIYDLLGRELTSLVNEKLKPGIYDVEWDASDYSSGIYFYKLITDEFIVTKKMVLLK